MKSIHPICMAFAAAALLAGCATQEMSSTPFYTGNDVKYTDKVEDRVSLWPLLYHRAPVTSVLWPLFSSADDHVAIRPLYSQYMKHGQSEYNEYNVLWPIAQFDTYDNDNRIFPVFWGDDYFTVFPVFWNTDDIVAVPPVIVDKDGDGMAVLPLFFWDWKDDFNTLFPLWWYDGSDSGYKFWAAAGLAGAKSSKYKAHTDRKQWLLPLFWHHSDVDGDSEEETLWACAGLGGYRRTEKGFRHHWLLPLYISDRDDFYSLPYSRVNKGSKAVTSYFMAGLGGHSSVDGKYDSSWLFPIFSHNAADETFVTPLCYSDKDTLVTPIYGHTKDADWLLPLYYHGTNTFITPLFGAAKEVNWAVPLYWQDENTFLSLAWSHYRGPDGKLEAAVSPLLLSGYNRDRKTGDSVAYILAGLAGRVEKADGTGGSWAFPLYYKDAETFFTLLYGHTKTSEWLFPLYYREGDTMLTPIAGRKGGTSWVFPLYIRDENSFTSIAYSHTRNPQTGEESMIIPPLLAGCAWNTNTQESAWAALAGLVGSTTAKDGSHERDWFFPLYARDKDSFVSIAYAHNRNPQTGEESVIIPPLLAGCAWNTNNQESAWAALAGLVGSTTARDGSHSKDWFFPLWHHEEDRSFTSLLFGWNGGGTSQTNNWWLTPLVGTESGRNEGFWLFPFMSQTHYGDFSRIESLAGVKELPPEIQFEEYAYTNYEKKVSMRLREKNAVPSAGSKTKAMLFFTPRKRYAYASLSWDGKTYRVHEEFDNGNELLLNSESSRTVTFDPKTRKKTGEDVREEHTVGLGAIYNSSRNENKNTIEEKSNTLLGILYNRRKDVDKKKNTSFEESAVLLKVWQRAEKNGDVSVDAFPGFTYDAKKNGYRKVSLLWRLFRHVNDPEKGTTLDLFFIPLSRP